MRKWRIPTVLILLLSAGMAFGSEPVVDSSGAKTAKSPSQTAAPMAVVDNATYVFPETLDGTEVSHDFVIRNTGQAPLVIDSVEAGWGCTTVSFTRTIPAGGEGTITIKVNTKGYGGKTFSKNARVKTNGPPGAEIKLTMTGPVASFADITPNPVSLNGPAGTPLKQQVQVIPGENILFKITGAKARDGKFIRFEVKEATVAGRSGYVVDVENTKTDTGSYKDFIDLDTDSKLNPQLTVRIYGSIRDVSQAENDNTDPKGGQQAGAAE